MGPQGAGAAPKQRAASPWHYPALLLPAGCSAALAGDRTPRCPIPSCQAASPGLSPVRSVPAGPRAGGSGTGQHLALAAERGVAVPACCGQAGARSGLSLCFAAQVAREGWHERARGHSSRDLCSRGAAGKGGDVSSVALTGPGKVGAETRGGGERGTRGLGTAGQIPAGINLVPGLPASPRGLPRGPGEAAAASRNLGHRERKQAPWPASCVPRGAPVCSPPLPSRRSSALAHAHDP